MALKPLKGKPGQFLDTSTGKVLDISEYREDDKYDTNVLPAGIVTAGTENVFFRDVASKRLIDSNLTQQSRLSAGEEMVIERVGATVSLAIGNVLPKPADIKKVVENAFMRVEINRLLLIEGPLLKFPSGYGLAGQTQETDQGIVSIGVPSTAAAAKLVKTQYLTSNHEMEGRMTFYDRNWMGAAVAVGDRMPTLASAVAVKLWLHGLVKSAVSK
jgi:hypothetical protein